MAVFVDILWEVVGFVAMVGKLYPVPVYWLSVAYVLILIIIIIIII